MYHLFFSQYTGYCDMPSRIQHKGGLIPIEICSVRFFKKTIIPHSFIQYIFDG